MFPGFLERHPPLSRKPVESISACVGVCVCSCKYGAEMFLVRTFLRSDYNFILKFSGEDFLEARYELRSGLGLGI